MKQFNVLKHIKSSINLKILWITIVSFLAFMIVITAINYSSLNQMKEKTLENTEIELTALVEEYYDNYLDALYVQINHQMDNLFDELFILSDTLQTVFSNRSTFEELIEAMKGTTYFFDDLKAYSNYMQNASDEPSVVAVAGYLYEDETIQEEAVALIEDTMILDLIMPSFMKHGVDKMQIYFQGGENKEIFRLVPWKNIGEETLAVYPELFNRPIWEAYNPGLAGQWRELIKSTDIDHINDLMRVTPPVQDGLSGDIVLTLSQPIANENLDEFEGTLSYDVSIGDITKMIETISISSSGFAFITQSNGNVFSVNEQGLKTLGILNDEDSMVEEQLGFNRLERFFDKSKYPSIQTLEMNNTDELEIKTIQIDGVDYMFASRHLYTYQSWTADRGFFDESWQIGFMVPKNEVYSMFFEVEKDINDEVSTITQNTLTITFILAIVLLVFIYKFNQMVTNELVVLSKVAHAVKMKNYDVEIPVTSSDEVGVLASAFKEMVSEVKSSFEQMEQHNERLQAEIVERVKKDRIIDYLENFDSGTDLPNKKALQNILKEMKNIEEHFVSLVVIGLDEFRKVNEAYSWTFGDQLIVSISERLKSLIPEDAILFKLSGDEFAFILKENKLKNLMNVVEDVSLSFKKPFKVGEYDILIGSSIGISSYPFDTEEPTDLFRFATNAMIHCKDVHKGRYEFYSAEMNDTARMRMMMLNELRSAVENDELMLMYQPIISVKTKEVTGMEALLRWDSKALGSVSPSIFVPLAEKTDLMVSIGEWIFRQALIETKLLYEKGYDQLNVAINVSVMQFLDVNFVQEVEKTIQDVGFDASKITIEITEGLFIKDLDRILKVLNDLRGMGISISVDDFGTGYSSLAYIKDLPLSKLKIDRSFIHEINEDMSQKLVSAIIGLAHNLNLNVVAEGIETEEQLRYIEEKNCEELQGYLFSKPLTLKDFVDFLDNQ